MATGANVGDLTPPQATIGAADYKATIVTGKTWYRAYRVVIMNPYMGDATIGFDEEKVTEILGVVKSEPSTTLSTLVDPTAVVPILDPITGQATGETMTHYAVYCMLYSLYRMLGQARDEAEAAAAAEAARVAALRDADLPPA